VRPERGEVRNALSSFRIEWAGEERSPPEGVIAVTPIPEGCHSVTPCLLVDGAARGIDSYRRAFGAVELLRLEKPGGKVGHAEIRIGDSLVMLADEVPEQGALGPKRLAGAGVGFMLYVEDPDAMFAQAVEAGAEVVRPLQDQFYGDRNGTLKDPFGHVWTIGSHVEEGSAEEVQRRMDAMSQASG
jgi:PhnB protein